MPLEPVLIQTDNEQIEKEQDFLNDSVSFLQTFYNAIKALGLSATLQEMVNITLSATQNYTFHPERVIAFVADKLLDKAGSPDFNGVPIHRTKLREMLALPDTTALEGIIRNFLNENRSGVGIRPNLLTLANDVVGKAAGADEALTAEYTYYTKTDKGVTMANHLNAVCSALNDWLIYGQGTGVRGPEVVEVVPGIKYSKGAFVPDLNFIRNKE